MNELFNDKAQNLGDYLGDKKVDLTVTSPPYANAINYEKHREGGDWTEREELDLDEYLEQQQEIFQELYENTREGGYCAVVIGVTKLEGVLKVPLPHHFAIMMEDVGWRMQETITWNKVTGGIRFANTVTNPYPEYYYPNQMKEEIQIWRKGERSREKREDSRIEIDDIVKKEVANNVWHIAPEPPDKYPEHPCPFPEEIPYRLVKLYTNKNDIVCDPMAGIGTTLKVAKHLDRRFIGTELNEEYAKVAKDRIENEKFERRDQLVPDFPLREPEDF